MFLELLDRACMEGLKELIGNLDALAIPDAPRLLPNFIIAVARNLEGGGDVSLNQPNSDISNVKEVIQKFVTVQTDLGVPLDSICESLRMCSDYFSPHITIDESMVFRSPEVSVAVVSRLKP